MPPPAPPLPPFGPMTTQLIKVVPRQTSHRSSFSQLDGQDNSVDNSLDDSDCSATVAYEGVPPTASSAPLQPPPPQTPPTNGAECKSPVGVIEVKVKAAAEVKQAPVVSTPERHYRPLEPAREKRRLRLEESQRSRALSAWEKERGANRCVRCNHDFGWAVEEIVICKTWLAIKSEGSKPKAKITSPADSTSYD